jgi:hypothetical protein
MFFSFDKLFNKVLFKTDDPKELSLSDKDLLVIYCDRLHTVVGNPRVRKLFKSINIDEDMQQVVFQLKEPLGDGMDIDFVINILSTGMVIEWLQPKVDSIKHTSVMIGGKDERKIVDNYKPMIERLNNLKYELSKLIRDHGSVNNRYLSGN